MWWEIGPYCKEGAWPLGDRSTDQHSEAQPGMGWGWTTHVDCQDGYLERFAFLPIEPAMVVMVC